MRNLKKILKISGLIILIVFACLGIGIAGGIPISSSNRKEDKQEIKIELLDTKEDAGRISQFEIEP